MSTTHTAYPLSWPTGWPRTERHRRVAAPFFSSKRQSSGSGATYRSWNSRGQHSMSESTDEVLNQLRNLGATGVVISTNIELKQDGLPYSNRRTPDDQGAAVYFHLKGRKCVLAVDKWNRVEDNLWAVAKHVEALRGQERWGCGSVEQAFAGYTAIGNGGLTKRPWREVFRVDNSRGDITRADIEKLYRTLVWNNHPDHGGSEAAMAEINVARDEALKEILQ